MIPTDLPTIIQTDTQHAIDDLTGGGLRPVSPAIAATICTRLAHMAYTAGKHDAIRDLKTVAEVATILGVNGSRVRVLAKHRGVGWQVSRGTWLFSPADVDAMRVRTPGRPQS